MINQVLLILFIFKAYLMFMFIDESIIFYIERDNVTHNGAYFLLRHQDGTYQWNYIYDYLNPVPDGESLRATRTIRKSPFPQDGNNTYYFGGYDCLSDTSHNTAWICKGVLHRLTAEMTEFESQMSKVKIYPNPSHRFVKLENIPNQSTIQIRMSQVK